MRSFFGSPVLGCIVSVQRIATLQLEQSDMRPSQKQLELLVAANRIYNGSCHPDWVILHLPYNDLVCCVGLCDALVYKAMCELRTSSVRKDSIWFATRYLTLGT